MTQHATIDWRSLRIAEVWEALGGSPLTIRNGRARARAWWRDGDGINISIDSAKNCWFDHARGSGGGVLDLATAVLGDRRAALEWLSEQYGEGVYQPPSIDDRKHAEYARLWHAARVRQLERVHDSTYRAMLAEQDDTAADIWARASREVYVARHISEHEVIEQFTRALEADPRGVARLIDEERENERGAEEIAARIVACIAYSADREAARHAA